jgi:thermitase
LRKSTFLSQIASLLIILLLIYFPAHSMAGELRVTLEGENLSLTVEKVPLQTILLELARDGVAVKIDPQINPIITANFKSRPVEQALETILKPASYSLLWEARTDKAGKNILRLAEIQVFQSERKHLMKSLAPKRIFEISEKSAGVFYVKDEILLYLPMGTDLAELEKFIQAYDATIIYSSRLPGPAKILLPPNSDVFAIAREIKKKLNIDMAQPNYAYPLESPVVSKITLKEIDIDPGLYAPTNNNVPIAILDSGLADNAELEKFVMSSFDVMNPEAAITDTLGHGTQMAYIASGVVKPYGSVSDASYMPIIPIRAFDDNGYTTDLNIMNSINFALANNARVMSLSWGSETRSDFMEKSFEYAKAQGLVIVASAGNQATGKPVYPAAYPTVIGVGALGPHGKTWENSNYGNFVALYAPGFANLPVGHKGEPGMYAGTSISTALVANSIASYLSENPAATSQEIHDFLQNKY